jgi:hypothetical protein
MESVTCLRWRSATPPVLMGQDRREAPLLYPPPNTWREWNTALLGRWNRLFLVVPWRRKCSVNCVR